MRTLLFLSLAAALLTALSGCRQSAPRPTAKPQPPSAPARSVRVARAPASRAPLLRAAPYMPLSVYPYDPSKPGPTESKTYEGKAPATDAELQAAIQQNPGTDIARAQKVYVRPDGQRMWQYTETTPITPRIEILDFQFSEKMGGSCSGSIVVRNLTGMPIKNLQVVLLTSSTPLVLVASGPARLGSMIELGQGGGFSFSGQLDGSEKFGPCRVRAEAQVDGPPGLVTAEIPVTIR
jgi:hypothetical protein